MMQSFPHKIWIQKSTATLAYPWPGLIAAISIIVGNVIGMALSKGGSDD